MLVDYHVHLEEGPYSLNWLNRTIKALDEFDFPNPNGYGSRERLIHQTSRLEQRMKMGCFSKEWLRLYLQKAKQIGLKEVGIVDHLYRFRQTSDYFNERLNLNRNNEIGAMQAAWLDNVMNEDMDEFVEAILSAQQEWENEGVKLRLGIEADYFPGGEEELTQLIGDYPWDFVIGSIHFVEGWGFDNHETVHVFQQWDTMQLYDRFYETVEKMIRSELFDFVAHIDNLKVFNIKVEDEAFNRGWYDRIAAALIETDTATEVNAGLYYRYPVKEMCPGPEFLSKLVNKGVSFTTSSDSHFPDDLGNYISYNAQTLKSLGLKEIATFSQRKKIMKPLELASLKMT